MENEGAAERDKKEVDQDKENVEREEVREVKPIVQEEDIGRWKKMEKERMNIINLKTSSILRSWEVVRD